VRYKFFSYYYLAKWHWQWRINVWH